MAVDLKELSEVPERTHPLWRKRLELEGCYSDTRKTELDFNRPHMYTLAKAARLGLRLLGLWNRGRKNAVQPVLIESGLTVSHLPPSLEGLRILHLSDFHFSKFDTEQVPAIVNLLKGIAVDLCCVTGDYKYGHMGNMDHIRPAMDRVLQSFSSTHGAFGILGNHDFSFMIPELESAGLRMLVNEGTRINLRDTPVWIGGTDDPHNYRCDDVHAAMKGAKEDTFNLLMIHSPERIAEAAQAGAHLYLCGHTHGGQICLPGWGMLKSNADCERQFAEGTWHYENMAGNTTRGLGVTDVPVRYCCPPEANLLTLRRG